MTSARRGLLVPSLVALASLAVLVSLGVWQLQRLAWKEDLIAKAAARATAPAQALPPESAWPSLAPQDYEFRRVRLAGRFLHDREVHVFAALPERAGRFGGPGYRVFTPLTLAEGAVVFVNRGFVPMDRKDPATRKAGQVEGPVEITGLMRAPDRPGLFTPDPDPARNTWFVRDPSAMAHAAGLGRVAPFYVDAAESAPGGLPQGGETRLVFPNPHLGYALTWFGLAAVLMVMFGLWVRSRSKQAHAPLGDGGRLR